MTWIDNQPETKIAAALERYRADERPLARRCKKVSDGDDRYGLWLLLVDITMRKRVGVGYEDIADWTWADAYHDGMSPRDAVTEALAADDTFSSMGA